MKGVKSSHSPLSLYWWTCLHSGKKTCLSIFMPLWWWHDIQRFFPSWKRTTSPPPPPRHIPSVLKFKKNVKSECFCEFQCICERVYILDYMINTNSMFITIRASADKGLSFCYDVSLPDSCLATWQVFEVFIFLTCTNGAAVKPPYVYLP